MRSTITRCLLVLMLAAGSAAAQDDVEVRTLDQEFLLGNATRVHLGLSLGEIRVEGIRGNRVLVELHLFCTRQDMEACKRRADRLRIVPRIGGDTFEVKLKRTNRGRLQGIKAVLRIGIPNHLPLEVDTKNGNIYVTGMRSAINVNNGAGNIDVTYERAQVAKVTAHVGVGNARLLVGSDQINATGFPRGLSWSGTGTQTIDLDAGAGDIEIRLQ